MEFDVVIPTYNEAPTVAGVIDHCMASGAEHILVVDSGSADGTPEIARSAGAQVHDSSGLFTDLGPARGKGDALWRALPLTSSPVVAFLDGDLTVFDDLLARLLLPLEQDGTKLSKANIFRLDGAGHRRFGRVSRYTAGPILQVEFPELADMDEPLSGQVAAPRDVLMRLPFELGYGLEIGMLIDICQRFGRGAISHPDCGRVLHAEQTDTDLVSMATVVARAALSRVAPRPAGEDPTGHTLRPPHIR